MSRPLLSALLCLVLTAGFGALAVVLGLSSLPVVPGGLLLAYAAIAEPPVAAALTAALIGVVMDVLSGTPVGVQMLSCVAVLLLARLFVTFVSQPRGAEAALFTGAVSVALTFLSLLLLFLFQRREAFGFLSILSVGVGNGIAAFVALPLFQWVFVRLGLEDRGESLNERLATKR